MAVQCGTDRYCLWASGSFFQKVHLGLSTLEKSRKAVTGRHPTSVTLESEATGNEASQLDSMLPPSFPALGVWQGPRKKVRISRDPSDPTPPGTPAGCQACPDQVGDRRLVSAYFGGREKQLPLPLAPRTLANESLVLLCLRAGDRDPF